jgi:hypothetical protein
MIALNPCIRVLEASPIMGSLIVTKVPLQLSHTDPCHQSASVYSYKLYVGVTQ